MNTHFLALCLRLFSRKTRAKQRAIIRGHRNLTNKGGERVIADLKRALSDTPLVIDSSKLSSWIMGGATSEAIKELCLRQYLLVRVGAYKLNEELLFQKSANTRYVSAPLPSQWRKHVEDHGFKVSTWRSNMYWHGYLILLLGYGLLRSALIIFESLLSIQVSPKKPSPFVFFCNLTHRNLPNANNASQSYDIISWYINFSQKRQVPRVIRHDIKGVKPFLKHGVAIESQLEGPIPNLPSLSAISKFASWSLLAALFSLFDLLRGRWWHALMFHECVLEKKANMARSEDLADEYFFHQTGQTYRPLWTYGVENRGSKVSLYFYSVNIENICLDPAYFWRCMTWSKYLVWDSFQGNFIRRCIGDSQDVEIEVVKSIWFEDDRGRVPNITKPHLLIFDVSPHRLFQYSTYADENQYVVPTTCVSFIQDIRDAARQEKIICLLKAKRNIGKLSHPKYRRYFSDLNESEDVKLVTASASPYNLIPRSRAVICFPFTAPAIIARELGKPSCYYDPLGIIEENHPAAHGIEIIGSKASLLEWIKEHVA